MKIVRWDNEKLKQAIIKEANQDIAGGINCPDDFRAREFFKNIASSSTTTHDFSQVTLSDKEIEDIYSYEF